MRLSKFLYVSDLVNLALNFVIKLSEYCSGTLDKLQNFLSITNDHHVIVDVD